MRRLTLYTAGPLYRLLRRNLSVAQLAGYAMANLLGLSIILTAIQFYADVTPSGPSEESDGFIARDFMVISKRVDGISAVPPAFSEQETADLGSQPWVRRVGAFTASRFNVSASVEMGGRGMSTYLFFESIPDEFFDIRPSDWHFDPATAEFVPVIISRDYLALYNFGFAATRGLPQLSEALIGTVPVRLYLSGAGRSDTFPAYVVGFSSRLNTIAVPQSFMDWANSRYAPGSSALPSRLIVEVTSPGSPEIGRYLSERGWETAGDKAESSRALRFFTVVTSVAASIGLVILLLSVCILLLGVHLLLQKSRSPLRNLMLLGYSPRAVSALYVRLVAAVNGIVAVVATVVAIAMRGLWLGALSDMGLAAATTVLPVLMAAILSALIITFVNALSIRRTMLKFWYER